MKKYEYYRDSGVEWIGEIPNHWEKVRIKYVLSRSNAGVWGNEKQDDENDIACFRAADFDYPHGILRLDKITFRNIPFSQLEGRTLSKGDLLIEKSGGGDNAPVGRVIRYTYDGKATCSNFIHSISTNESFDSNFLYYYFHSMYSNKVNILFFNQTTGLQNLQVGDYLAQSIFAPSLNEQKAIGSYLDEQTTRIDNIIEARENKIKLLEELRASIISKAVTKGIRNNSRTKDSGIEWIGQIPVNWTVLPFKRVFKLRKGLSITKADLVEEGIPVISYGQIHAKFNDGVHTKKELLRYVPSFYLSTDISSLVKKGDFIFADTSEDLEGCGNNVHVDINDKIFGGYHTIIATPLNSTYSRYFAYLFKTSQWRHIIRSRVNGVKLYSITQEILGKEFVIIPPLDEQIEIFEFLEDKCAKIDHTIGNANKEILLLKEYRSSLINEVVTGKRKVV